MTIKIKPREQERWDEARELMYRYEDVRYAAMLDEWENPIGVSRPELRLLTYPIKSRTPKGVWLDMGFGDRKFILLTARKRYACPTKEEALASFVARKERQADILGSQLARVNTVIEIAKCLLDPNYEPKDYGVTL